VRSSFLSLRIDYPKTFTNKFTTATKRLQIPM
jgi:hypothetical protein